MDKDVGSDQNISRIEFAMLTRSLKGFIQQSDEQAWVFMPLPNNGQLISEITHDSPFSGYHKIVWSGMFIRQFIALF